MMHAVAARISVWMLDRAGRMNDRRGQGTVEYVGVVVTMALLLGAMAVGANKWGGDVGESFKKLIMNAVGFASDKLPGGK